MESTKPESPSEQFTYDAAGNRTASGGKSYTYDAAGRLTSAEGFQLTYDASGNLIRKSAGSSVTEYTYDAENLLTSVRLPNGSVESYKYDPLGRRIERAGPDGVIRYAYSGDSILLETDAAGTVVARYVHGPETDNPLMLERGGQTYFYHSDAMGSVGAVTGAGGEVVCRYAYESFGKPDNCGAIEARFRFAGREYDSASGLYYLRARYYDPVTGRFLTPDPLDLSGPILANPEFVPSLGTTPQSLNRYSYAVNNPLSFRDPYGLKADKKLHSSTEAWREDQKTARVETSAGLRIPLFLRDGTFNPKLTARSYAQPDYDSRFFGENSTSMIEIEYQGEGVMTMRYDMFIGLRENRIVSEEEYHFVVKNGTDREALIYKLAPKRIAADGAAAGLELLQMAVDKASEFEYFNPHVSAARSYGREPQPQYFNRLAFQILAKAGL